MKILLYSVLTFTVIISIVLFGSYFFVSPDDNFVYSKPVPVDLKLGKTISSLSKQQLDSLKSLEIDSNRIEVVGSGYSGYDFYIWHMPIEKGYLFIKAFDINSGMELSKEKFEEETKIEISKGSNNFQFYSCQSTIYEGNLGKYYAARFEAYFHSEKSGKDKKIANISYLIDGWDR